MLRSLVGSEMCIRDRVSTQSTGKLGSGIMEAAAEAHKQRGNQLFSDDKFTEAICEYTQAIEMHPHHTFYSNRSAAFCKLSDFERALQDGNLCVECKPGWHKAHLRVGDALMGLKRWVDALESYKRALECDDANHKTVKSKIEEATTMDREHRKLEIQQQITVEVMQFARLKSAAQQLIQEKQYQQARTKYEGAIESMGALVDKLPAEQQEQFRQLLATTRAEMEQELERARQDAVNK
eukprot:TRINITY_DN16531_c0_g1_i1.p1 TRINITY_DN16531_c0_g1~~TRINITY_DN16531_c0_g1_i1.p1  ORF type:complete len:269 (+),score=76.29 TRINITY_DN16531_c0_g1_i1:96-809(+)